MSRRSLVGPAVVFALVHSQADAQQAADTIRLEQVVVTATRLEEPRRSAPASLTVVSGEELRRRGIRFVAEWLREVPGAAVVPTGSYGGLTSLFLRGGESDYAKILIDGVPANLPGGAVDLANLSTEHVERIEVLRGPASVLYGSDAVSGVVHILTREGRGPAVLRASARAGGAGSSDLRLSAGAGGKQLAWSGGLSRFGSSGTYAFNNEYRSWVLAGGAALRPDSLTAARLSVRLGDHRSEFPTDFTGMPSDSNQYGTEKGWTLALGGSRRLSPFLEARINASGWWTDVGYSDLPDGPGDTQGFGFRQERLSRFRRQLLDLRLVAVPFVPLRLTAGAEALRESERQQGETTSDFGDGPFTETADFDQDRHNLAAYAQTRWEAVPGVDIHLGGRWDRNQVFGTFRTWRAGLVVLPTGAWRAHLAAGSAFKQPAFAEQFADTPFEIGNPGLRPERSFAWEAGLEASFLDRRVSIDATFFDQRFRDLIQYAFVPGEPSYHNVASAAARGIELSADASPLPELTIGFRWTGLHTRVGDAGASGPSFEHGRRLLRRPANVVSFVAGWRGRGGAVLEGALTRVGARDDVDFREFPAERVTLPGYTLLALSGELPMPGAVGASGSGLALTARIENLFDASYENVVGFPGRGRLLMVGVRYGP